MKIREQVENNPIIFFLGTLLVGFLAGLGVYKGILEIAHLEVIPRVRYDQCNNSVPQSVMPQPSEEENCNLINPTISYPPDNIRLPSPILVGGKVKKIPKSKNLWAMLQNPNTKTYTDIKKIVPTDNKEWHTNMHMTGGKVGDEYVLFVALVDDSIDSKLSNYEAGGVALDSISNKIGSIKRCTQVSVMLQQ